MATMYRAKRGDNAPPLAAILKDANGVAIPSVTAAKMLLRRDGTETVIERTMSFVGPQSDCHVIYGWVSGDWTGANAITAGTYWLEFELTRSAGGTPLTVPTDDYDMLEIWDDFNPA